MFSHHCSACERTQLMFTSQVTGLVNDERGIVLSFRCWCGSEQTRITGRRAAEARPSVAA